MRFVSRSLRSSGVFVDVERGDVLVEVFLNTSSEVFKPLSLSWVCPSLPNRPKLHHHVDWREDMLGQREEALEKGSGFGLGAWSHAGNGSLAQGVDAEPENPGLGARIVGGRGGVQCHRKPLPWL